MIIEFKWPDQVPTSEFDYQFIQGMLDRMATSFAKYGLVKDAYPARVDAIGSLDQRLEKYERTGNTEFLMDAANFAMIEYAHPRNPAAYFKATDSKESGGRKWVGEVDPSQRSNKPEEWI